jgi:putative ABC transport system permease protein
MVKHIKIAYRFLLKHKEYSLVNIGGLAFSMICVMLIGLYLFDELSHDRFHHDAQQIFRVIEQTSDDSGDEVNKANVAFLISAVQNVLPEVNNTLKIISTGRQNIFNDENSNVFHELVTFTEQSFFEIFDYPLLRGDRTTALKNPYSAVLTESMAVKIFGSIDVVGKVIHLLGNEQPFQVTGVLKEFPSNTHLKFSVLYSMESLASDKRFRQLQSNDWSSDYFSTYYKLIPEADPSEVSARLTDLVNSKRPENGKPFRFWLQPLTDVHFHSANIRGGYNSRPGDIHYVYIFGAVGLFMLIIACVNYINLSTAFSITRSKEIGVKKVSGAYRSQLITQFITESTVIATTSVILALILVNALLPAFNAFSGKTIETGLLFKIPSLLVLAGFALIIGVLSGSYPAFHMSRLTPVIALRGFSGTTRSTSWIRKGLVVFQFTLSIILIISSITAYRQIEFIRNKNLGFNAEQLVVLDINSGLVRKGSEIIKTELSRLPSTKRVTVSSRVPGEWKNIPQVKVTTKENPVGSDLFFIGADEDFLETFQIDLLKGRDFLPGNSDSASVLINETAAQLLGISDPGYPIVIPSANFGVSDELLDHAFNASVVGVVRDFNFQSLHQKIAPMVIAYRNNPIHSIDYFTVRLMLTNLESTLKAFEKVIKDVDPDHPLEYNFLDERLADFYNEDLKRGELFGIAAVVSVGLACLGLFSLASFSTQQRTKEIGIRKVLGASVVQITALLSGDYLKLVALGFVIAAPLAYIMLSEWLSSFAYRIQIGALILLVAGFLSIMVAMLTVGFKSVKAAIANPVKSLKSE